MQVNLTNRCNFLCSHCSQSTGHRQESDLTMTQLQRVFEIAESLAVQEITFSGGEPLLSTLVLDAVKIASQIGMKTAITTNGSLLSPKLVARLRPYICRVELSLDGPDATTHDSIRRPGSFEHLLSAVDAIRSRGLVLAVIVTVTKHNLQLVDEIVNTALSFGSNLIGVNAVIPSGNALSCRDILLTPLEKKALYKKVLRLAERHKSKATILSEDPLFNVVAVSERTSGAYAQVGGGCVAGRSLMIDSDGVIYPCSLLPVKISHIYHPDPIKQIIGSEIRRCLIRGEVEGECGSCRFKPNCMGCRAAAQGLTGSYLSSDPTCWLSAIEGKKDNCFPLQAN